MYKLLIILLLSSSYGILAQEEDEKYVPETDSLVIERIKQWQDLKFGLLMHWGPYCQWGIVESWSICPEDEGWCQRNMNNYIEYKTKYESLQHTFNPTKFDPSKWAKAAKEAGMKYVVFTTKHHDGFCMFDSKYTDYKVTSSDCPFHTHKKSNIAKEIFDEFKKQGLWTGAYFSKPDWHSEYYWWPYFPPSDRNVNYDPEIYPERWEKFVKFTHNQVLELMTDYGNIDILWLDGGWVAKKDTEEIKKLYHVNCEKSKSGFIKRRYINQDIRMDELVKKARKKQPGLIVVDRAVHGKNQNYLTPENRIPKKILPYPWESCIISGGGWSFTPDAKYMSGREAVHLLIDIVSKGGNLLLNIAPGPDGEWQQGAYDLLSEIGKWMKINGNAIYNSKPIAPYKEGQICMTHQKNNVVHLYYLAKEDEQKIPGEIHVKSLQPASGAKITLLGTETTLKWKKKENGFVLYVPEILSNNPPCNYAWTFEISRVTTKR